MKSLITLSWIGFFCGIVSASPCAIAKQQSIASAEAAPKIVQLLDAARYQAVLKEREIEVSARFVTDPPPAMRLQDGERHYQFYAAMLLRADYDLARKTLTDPSVYRQIVPFVSSAEFDKNTGILNISGGVLGYHLKSKVQFTERSEGWVEFQILGGSFMGLKGNFYFEDRGEDGTLAYFGGRHIARQFPPSFVMTRGGEIALSISGRKMRKYIEEQGKVITSPEKVSKDQDDAEIPQPRSHIQ